MHMLMNYFILKSGDKVFGTFLKTRHIQPWSLTYGGLCMTEDRHIYTTLVLNLWWSLYDRG